MRIKMHAKLMLVLAVGFFVSVASAQSSPSPSPASIEQESQVEIYRIAPGQHEEFLKFVALCDEANKQAGMPPRQLYVHQDGANWDFLLIQPLHNTPEQNKAWSAAATRLGIPHGGDFFLAIRKFVAEHTDTSVTGPTTAGDWLKQIHNNR
jgi:hypothetical protein